MSNIGVLIEIDGQEIKAASYGLMTAARTGGSVIALLFSEDGERFKTDLERFGAEKIVAMPGEGPVQKANVLAAAIKEYDLRALM